MSKHISNKCIELLVFVALCILCSSNAALADPITYQLTGTVSGTIGTTTLTNATFTFVGNGDSTGVFEPDPGVFVNPLSSVTVSLSGIGVASVIDAFYFYANPSVPGAGFIDIFTGDVLDFGATEFSSYDGVSPMGPLFDVSEILLAPFDTTDGTLNLSSATDLVFTTSNATTTTPEPSSFALCGLVLAAVLVAVRHQAKG
jgi:hypothetical protein